MAVTRYEKDGKIFWRVYLDLRGRRNRRARVQKRINGIETEREAVAVEKKLLRELSTELERLESQGLTWEEVIDRWVRHQELYPTKKYAVSTLQDYESITKKWTQPWLNRVASELNRGDGRDVLRYAEESEKSAALIHRLKCCINLIYKWGIEEGLITGVHQSPVYGLDYKKDREEKRPEILTSDEIRTLLKRAREQNNKWYPVWVSAVLTGCRSGELHQLRRNDLEVISRDAAAEEDKKPFDQKRYGFLRVRRSWSVRTKSVGPTKAGYWRNVPVSSGFYWFLMDELHLEEKRPDDFLLPRFWEWDKGLQARALRMFCIGNGLPSVKFHALRACFATQLISTGIPPAVVMKICGWKDLKTMQRYIRLAGIDEAGATEVLRFIPTEEAVMEKGVDLYDHEEE
ncbi:MAG TPA: tyrosine-type recombinase/integrase [Bdellovibrionota bacterium]|nr:tyrosine-type recombinase/integrase [Bdellovibrionota bacterium]